VISPVWLTCFCIGTVMAKSIGANITNMKILFLNALLFFSLQYYTVADEVILGLKNGNASQVSKFFDNTVDITLFDKTNSYSKSQAGLVLQDFLLTNNVKDFRLLYKGGNSGSQFCIGTLQTGNGEYRTSIYLKLKGDKQVLQDIRFEK
jgi:Domain of unknown function (DUF4783)